MAECYLRRSGQPWTLARPHHTRALRLYLDHMREERGQEEEDMDPGEESKEESEGAERHMIPNGDAMIISVPHTNGGYFVASFSHVEDDLYQFVDAYRNTVQIMMSDPARVALINRLTD